MTNEQAKQEAIKNAWQKYCVTNYNSSGFVDDIGAIYDIWNGDFEFGVGMHRPKILKGISDNNGWIRIEPDGSNLPDTSTQLYKVYYDGSLPSFSKKEVEFKYSYSTVKIGLMYKERLITHYKPIEKELLPIY